MFRVTGEATKEPIRFVFDRNSDTGGRAREWYHLTMKGASLPTTDIARMGPYAEGNRTTTIGLQAADLLAYSAFRHFSGKASWQWDALTEGKQVATMLFDEPYWQLLEDELKAGSAASSEC